MEKQICQNEPKINITLYQGLPKADKMELIIQKAVELGVKKVVPVETSRTVVKIKDGGEKKLSRWQNISLSAAKQCGRGIVPEIAPVLGFKEAVNQMSAGLAIMPYEEEKHRSIKSAVESFACMEEVSIFIGPEGGISPEEAAFAIDNGIIPVTLGRRILRTETAGFAAIIILLCYGGEYDGRDIF